MNNIVKHLEELIKQYEAEEKAAWKRAGQLEDVVADLKKIVQKVTSEFGEQVNVSDVRGYRAVLYVRQHRSRYVDVSRERSAREGYSNSKVHE